METKETKQEVLREQLDDNMGAIYKAMKTLEDALDPENKSAFDALDALEKIMEERLSMIDDLFIEYDLDLDSRTLEVSDLEKKNQRLADRLAELEEENERLQDRLYISIRKKITTN